MAAIIAAFFGKTDAQDPLFNKLVIAPRKKLFGKSKKKIMLSALMAKSVKNAHIPAKF